MEKGKRRNRKQKTPAKCLVSACDRKATRRGLCDSCRAEANRMVKRGETTEQELIEKGLMLPKCLVTIGLLAEDLMMKKGGSNGQGEDRKPDGRKEGEAREGRGDSGKAKSRRGRKPRQSA